LGSQRTLTDKPKSQGVADLSPHRSRFEFGKNWKSFLGVLDEGRILEAERSLQSMLRVDNLQGMRFLDAGCGSGLFSLAASRLGASVHSFDIDPISVSAAQEVRARYAGPGRPWITEIGSLLDPAYLSSLGQFDVVYSWGVMHHTGAMRQAFQNIAPLVSDGGSLFISIYNYQVYWSGFYRLIKRTYVSSPRIGRVIILGIYSAVEVAKGVIKDLIFLRNPITRYSKKRSDRGMSVWHDWRDWIGGYPFETAKPEEVFDFFRKLGFQLEVLKTCGGGHGCNEFVFRKIRT